MLVGNDGNDTLSGGGSDLFIGGAGADRMILGKGADRVMLYGAAESTRLGFDRVQSFDFSADRFWLPTEVTGIDSRNTGGLRTASFDADLAAVNNASRLLAGQAG